MTTSKSARLSKKQITKVHLADKVNDKGDVSAVCFSRPRKINMKTESWRLDVENGVNCVACIRKSKEKP